MLANIMSNRFFTVAVISVTLTSCMQDYADPQYAATEDGYEAVVAKNMNEKIARRIADNGGGNLGLSAQVMAQVTNPYNYTPGYAGANIPVQTNNAYGSLNNGIIQPGVFMQNQAPVYRAPTSFGGQIYSPTTGGSR